MRRCKPATPRHHTRHTRVLRRSLALTLCCFDFAFARSTKHRSSHEMVVSQMDARLKQIDRDAMIASRPHLRTAERFA